MTSSTAPGQDQQPERRPPRRSQRRSQRPATDGIAESERSTFHTEPEAASAVDAALDTDKPEEGVAPGSDAWWREQRPPHWG